jgi:deoxyribodipyrimidine photo-lyase
LETGHLKSFARDKAVRRWCRTNNVKINELDQTGVTRCLEDRDDFTKNFNRFLDQQAWQTPTNYHLQKLRETRLITAIQGKIKLHGVCTVPLKPSEMQQIPIEHSADRAERQYGGETAALSMLHSFLSQRACNYSSGISSPNTSWTSCSRLSPYLTWGNISLRYVIVTTKQKQVELRETKKPTKGEHPSPWLRSLASFQSRMHWRSHFMQKLETQPSIEEEDQCSAFSHLRRQPGDFNQEYFNAWCQGRTGFPFVDACMRCLLKCGWINFRMRAMLVSFATYNLWLDWKKIAPHLARLFLDYEPGIQ